MKKVQGVEGQVVKELKKQVKDLEAKLQEAERFKSEKSPDKGQQDVELKYLLKLDKQKTQHAENTKKLQD